MRIVFKHLNIRTFIFYINLMGCSIFRCNNLPVPFFMRTALMEAGATVSWLKWTRGKPIQALTLCLRMDPCVKIVISDSSLFFFAKLERAFSTRSRTEAAASPFGGMILSGFFWNYHQRCSREI